MGVRLQQRRSRRQEETEEDGTIKSEYANERGTTVVASQTSNEN
ncbi:uncharacterized protein G2W53_030785 [Senna tora]|uniref:Uncharacterized protein n=1 Tax=Senna tora TaxID=362788 RepID=A0A834WEW9_9FABA|nr:uncharacterized protein G2W53_030785 [Senna tora]